MLIRRIMPRRRAARTRAALHRPLLLPIFLRWAHHRQLTDFIGAVHCRIIP